MALDGSYNIGSYSPYIVGQEVAQERQWDITR